MTTARYYTITEEDGDVTKFRYISRTCHCGGCCYEDTLEVQDDDGDWLTQNIEGSDIKFLLRMLIEGSSEFVKEDKFHES